MTRARNAGRLATVLAILTPPKRNRWYVAEIGNAIK
jgi:hypothetical protein